MKRADVALPDPAQPGVIRRRLRSKTSAEPVARISAVAFDSHELVELPAVEPQHATNAVVDSTSAPDEDDQEMEEFKKVAYKAFCQRYRRWSMSKVSASTDGLSDHLVARMRRQCDLRRMSAEQKLVAAKQYYKEFPDRPDKSVVLEQMQDAVARRGKKYGKFLDVHAALLTFNGPWGEVQDIELPPPSSVDIIKEVCDELKKHERILQVWEEFKETIQKWQDTLFIPIVAYAFELCTTTLKEDRSIRVHAHVFLRSAPGNKIRVKNESTLSFRGVAPHKAEGSGVRGIGARSNAGMYYLQCPKIGLLFSGGSIQPFRDYLVNGEWIMNLVQAGKMDYKVARREMITSAKNLPRLLPALDRWHMEMNRLSLVTQIESVQAELDATRKPFTRLEAVTAWVASHEQNAMRYKFLVLCGGSGLGKTQFAKSLVPAGRTLELNMASAPEPDMREYDEKLHDLVLFDECAPKQILRQKKLFQCPAVEVGLAASRTSCHAYKVWVHKKLFVVATNVWQHEVATLPVDDALWLAANSVVVQVDQPLWEK